MTEQDNPSDSEGKNQLAGEDEIEQLLAQAASLAGQIAEETGAGSDAMTDAADAESGAPANDADGRASVSSAGDEEQATSREPDAEPEGLAADASDTPIASDASVASDVSDTPTADGSGGVPGAIASDEDGQDRDVQAADDDDTARDASDADDGLADSLGPASDGGAIESDADGKPTAAASSGEAASSVDKTLAELENLIQATKPVKAESPKAPAGKASSKGPGQAGRSQTAGVDIEQEISTGDVNVDLSEDALAKDAEKEGTGVKASAKKKLRKLVRSAPRVTRFAGQFAQTAMPATLLKVLRFVDRPFVGVSLSIRKRLGVVAAITFVAGAVLLALPFVCNRNPYVDLPP